VAERARRAGKRAASRPEGGRRSARKEGAQLRKKLPDYEAKRDFGITPEPAPGTATPNPEAPSFVVHKHDATRLHYDVRLEMDGALASWSVPKGPSYDPATKRLAVQTEDHPLEYGSFEGRIPDGEYGAGDSLIWDRGVYQSVPPEQASEQRKKGHIRFVMMGEKLKGEWHLVRTHGGAPGKAQWLLFKGKDGTANPSYDVVTERPESVVSGRVATRGPERALALRAPRAAPDEILKNFLPPMLATLVDEPPADEEHWIAERKYDGYRALCALSNRRVAMWTRNGLDLVGRFPDIARALSQIVVGDAVVDGEIAILDGQGVPRFELIQQGRNDEAVLFAFDLLRLDGEDLRARPIEERRDLLRSLLSNAPPSIRVSEELPPPFRDTVEEMKEAGWEGIVVKRRGSPYQKGRGREWLKVKALNKQELAIVGWMPGKGAAEGQMGALLLGVVIDGELRFAGKVGMGFSSKQRTELLRELSKDEVDKAQVAGAPRLRAAHWVKPRLVAEIQFTEWTADDKLRHPAFQGLRPDKTPMECVREKPARPPAPEPAPRAKKAGPKKAAPEPGPRAKKAAPEPDPRAKEAAPEPGARAKKAAPEAGPRAKKAAPKNARPRGAKAAAATVELTNPDRVLYPKDKITKADVAAYYDAVSEPMLRALADRPLVLIHWNQGIAKPSWFRQDIGQDAEEWMTIAETPARTKKGAVRHLVADRPEALRWLAQRSALEVHMWHSRMSSPTMPDWVVFDLDPAEGRGIDQAVEVAQILKGMFDRLGVPSIPKTTGKRGLHILVPLAPGHTYQDAESFALSVGETVAKQLDTVTLERSIAKRKGRLYFDCMQNGYGKTIIAPYSLRGAEGAPVSTPLRWNEVDASLDPRRFNLKTMPARLAEVGDLFEPALTAGIRLPRFKR
jgi:bifunctional non-homologous end joining protein LigD